MTRPDNKRIPQAEEPEVRASRICLPDVPPVIFEGKRYAQITQGHLEGLEQRTGLLEVIGDASGERLAVVKVYDVVLDEAVETDIQDVFFIRMELESSHRRLVIENEHMEEYAVGLDDLSVTPLE